MSLHNLIPHIINVQYYQFILLLLPQHTSYFPFLYVFILPLFKFTVPEIDFRTNPSLHHKKIFTIYNIGKLSSFDFQYIT